MTAYEAKIRDRWERLTVTLVAKKYLFTFLMIGIWVWKVAPAGWFEILTFVAAVLGLAEFSPARKAAIQEHGE